jgi:hypothetical protein
LPYFFTLFIVTVTFVVLAVVLAAGRLVALAVAARVVRDNPTLAVAAASAHNPKPKRRPRPEVVRGPQVAAVISFMSCLLRGAFLTPRGARTLNIELRKTCPGGF